MSELVLVEGDTLPRVNGTIRDDNGSPMNISGWVITLHIAYGDDLGGPLVKTALIPNGTDGFFEFMWEEGDLQPGRFDYELQFVKPDGVQTTQRNEDGSKLRMRINPQIA
jgi:hypothetical protein